MTEETIKETLYSYMENILAFRGPLPYDSPEFIKEIENFPPETRDIVNREGGLNKFLLKSVKFAQVREYICVMDDVVKAYKLPSCLASNFNEAKLIDNLLNEKPSGHFLNPNAEEYTPRNVHTVLEPNINDNYLSNGVNNFKSNHLSFNQFSTNHFNKTNYNNVNNNKTDINHAMDETLTEESVTYPKNIDLSQVPISNSTNEETTKGLQLLSMYFNENINEERRVYIGQLLKQYGIVKIPKKCNRCVQTDIPQVSQGTMTSDGDYEEAWSLVVQLSEEKNNLYQHKIQLETQLNSALDTTTKLQKKSQLDIMTCKKELEEKDFELNSIKEEYKNKVSKNESELKKLNISVNKAQEELKEHKKKLEENILDARSKQKIIQDLKEENGVLKAEKESLKTMYENLEEIHKESTENMNQEIVRLTLRAKEAELNLLKLKKSSVLQEINHKLFEAAQKKKELEDGLAAHYNTVPSVMLPELKNLQKELSEYINHFAAIKCEYIINIDEQLREMVNGASLRELKAVKLREFPKMPTLEAKYPLSSMEAKYPLTDKFPSMTLNAMLSQQIPTQQPNLAAALLNRNLLSEAVALQNSNQVASDLPISRQPQTQPFNLSGLVNNALSANISQTPNANLSSFVNSVRMPDINSQNLLSNFPLNVLQKENSILNPQQLPQQFPPPPPGMANLLNARLSGMVNSINMDNSSLLHTSSKLLPQNLPTANAASSQVQKNESSEQDGSNQVSTSSKKIKSASSVASLSKFELTSSTTSLSKDSNSSSKSSLIDNSSQVSSAMPSVDLSHNQIKNEKESSRKSESRPPKLTSHYEIILHKLKVAYPNYTRQELMEFLKIFRAQHNKLTGFTHDVIVSAVGDMMRNSQSKLQTTSQQNKNKPRQPVLVNKPLVSRPKPQETPNETKSSAANSNPWGMVNNSVNWSGENSDKSCTICLEEMRPHNTYRVDCGHKFHLACIRPWLNKQANCPVCRVHLLLPEDYPTLT